MVFPLLPFYARHFQASDITIGFLAASFAFGQFLFSPFWGKLSDFVGRKPIIMVALAGNVVAFLTFAFAEILPMLFIARFLQGVFSGAALPAAKAYVADSTTDQERIRGMGRLGAALSLGFMVGPAFGGILAEAHFTLPFLAAAGLAFLNLLFVMFFLRESLGERSRRLELKIGVSNITLLKEGISGPLAPLFVLAFLWAFAVSNNQVSVPLFGEAALGLGTGEVGIIFTFMGAASAFTQGIALPCLASRISERPTIVAGIGLMGLGLLLVPSIPSFIGGVGNAASPSISMGLVMALVAMGSGFSRPTINTVLSKETQMAFGATMGTALAFESFGRMLGPLAAGFIFAKLGSAGPFFASSAIIFASLVWLTVGRGFLRKR